MKYSKKPTKLFLKKLSKYSKTNKELYDNILNSLDIITKNPFNSTNRQLKSKKCPKCKRYRVGNYRIVYYVNTKKKFVEFIDVDDRANIYRKY
ncbi:type II toxin-antitoxin system RelE/ParE family toxin [Methanosphaera sp. ISO3-F5]|uniref:type II toxin-antitoxin system RelE family toxin n=1 Tax=Methanosphaera sp. ISO3-F5 TaxID=1452353 RepID=UPI002B25F035|nr:type II toxin-antitoxin system RelE/ParE family toxin [Methanosphaera sp. ISO3-F5]WQH65052.1 type II toxin-antitoxin system RelE/ParE family toxin [Methanosphaera sp. ISO3-F5]